MFTNYAYFKSISRLLNLTAAGKELFISQPALSKYLTRLEHQFGATLIDRTVKPIRLTEAGSVYLAHIEEHERQLRALSIDMSRFSKILHRVSVGITAWRGGMILPSVYESFLSVNENYNIEFVEAVGDVLLTLLENRKVDFCLMNISEYTDMGKFDWIALESEEIRLALQKSHPLFERKPQYLDKNVPVKLSDLQDESFVLLLPSQQLTRSADQLMRNQGFFPNRIVRLSSMSTALSIVARSEYITFYPHSQLVMNSFNANLTSRRIEAPASTIHFALVLHRSAPLSPAAVPVAEFLISMFGVPPSVVARMR